MAGENPVLVGKAGAIDALVAAMKAHVGNVGVSEQACLAMRNISVNNGVVLFVILTVVES